MTNPFAGIFADKAGAEAQQRAKHQKELSARQQAQLAFEYACATNFPDYHRMLNNMRKAAKQAGYSAKLEYGQITRDQSILLTLTSTIPMAEPHMFRLAAITINQTILLTHFTASTCATIIGRFTPAELTENLLQDLLTTWLRDTVK
ncbi:MAG: hypothetical protein K2X55_24400 [Burkholderiaceae bacterium]|nr:hypothetical protein [Burkholderiaceae bacterium]